jgi:hypothetical protein
MSAAIIIKVHKYFLAAPLPFLYTVGPPPQVIIAVPAAVQVLLIGPMKAHVYKWCCAA